MDLRRYFRYVLSLAICAFFIVNVLYYSHIFTDSLENAAYDLRLNKTLLNTTHEKIVVVDIDEKSLSELGHWPWSRNKLAAMVNTLFDYYKIDVLGFDVVFAEADQSSGLGVLQSLANNQLKENADYQVALEQLRPSLQYDRLFAESLRARNIVLGYVFRNQANTQSKGLLPRPLNEIDAKSDKELAIIKQGSYTANLPILQRNARTAGFFDTADAVDRDGVFRSAPLIQQFDRKIYPSLALATAHMALGSPEIKLVVISSGRENTDYNAIEYLQIGDRIIPVDERAIALAPFRGPHRKKTEVINGTTYAAAFNYFPAVDVLKRRLDKAALKDKIVLFGSSAAGLQDLRATPVGETDPGVEVHANLVAGILDNTIKHKPAYVKGYDAIILLLIGLLFTFLFPFLSPLLSSLVTLTIILLLGSINIFFPFSAWQQGLVLPIATQLLMIAVLYMLHITYGFFIETRNKRAISKVFGQYIPPELVDEMDADPTSDITLEGENREMTVLFSDVRGFTSISENLEPKELTQLMNDFLTPITATIHKHRGTIDKYMGDAVMAFWGAPLDDPYHQKNALLASLEMIEVLEEQQAYFKSKNWPEIKIGVGLNCGLMNVGNMGSEFRMAYTVLGDAVNLGSRLEGLTKQYGVQIIVGETMVEALPEFEFRILDLVAVKGREEPLRIYEPLGYSIELDRDIVKTNKRFARAFEQYLKQNWDFAEQEIFSIAQQDPDRLIYQIFLQRIQQFRENPPGDSWNGVYVHTSK